MEFNATVDSDTVGSPRRVNHGLWPLDEIDSKKDKFPCCIVWTPLPVVSWLAPYIGHVGICREDGAVLDFAGSNFVNVDNFAYGSVARYLQLDRELCCLPRNLASHTCTRGFRHSELGSAISWNDALHSSMQQFQHKYYNLFTCNCHSFVANCLNRLSYNGSLGWNMVNVAALVLWKGRWVDRMSIVRAFFPFVLVLCISILMAGWPFLTDELYLGYEKWLPVAPKVKKPRSIYNAASLAYLGDCIYELYARRHFLFPPKSIDVYNERVMAIVRCEAQDALLKKLTNEDYLTEEERDVLRWGKNIASSKTRTKKRAGMQVYSRASSLETLIGYLYLTDVKRLEDLMRRLGFSAGVSTEQIVESVQSKQTQEQQQPE